MAVIICNNPHFTDWYLSNRLADFVKHWLNYFETLQAEWHWYRLEYQSHVSTHAHGHAKLKVTQVLLIYYQKASMAWKVQSYEQ